MPRGTDAGRLAPPLSPLLRLRHTRAHTTHTQCTRAHARTSREHIGTRGARTHTHIYFLLDVSQLWPLKTQFAILGITSSVQGGFPPHPPAFIMSPSFLELEDIPRSPCTFPASVLQTATSPRSSGSFYWRIMLDLGARVLVAPAVPFLVGPQTARARTWMSVRPPCTHTCLSLSVHGRLDLH